MSFGWDWEDVSWSQVTAESLISMLGRAGFVVRTMAGRALGGAQHAESQAMVREEEAQNEMLDAVGVKYNEQIVKMQEKVRE
tara:strand:- start:176 stop:421 length:246 start_codon:yes stop_codon:yes gene_type:complete